MLLGWQVLSHGEERIPGPSLPQLDACLLSLTLLLPAPQKPGAGQLPRVSIAPRMMIHRLDFLVSVTVPTLFSWFFFRDIEILALFVSCLCHDLDHRGTNNSFQVASVRNREQIAS